MKLESISMPAEYYQNLTITQAFEDGTIDPPTHKVLILDHELIAIDEDVLSVFLQTHLCTLFMLDSSSFCSGPAKTICVIPVSWRCEKINVHGKCCANGERRGEILMAFINAVILDIDGTLLDSNDAHARAYVDAATSLGLTSDFKTVRRLIGKGSDKLIPEAFGFDAETDDGKNLDKKKGEIFRTQFLPMLQPTAGARELLLRLRSDGIKLVIATSAGKEDVDGLLERAGVKELLQQTTSADDADASKPEPDIVKAALKKVDAKPGDAVMLGDTPYDIEAARRAGVRIIALRSGGWTDDDLRGALAVYDHPADLLRHYDETLLGRR